jgi:hypothetical protein
MKTQLCLSLFAALCTSALLTTPAWADGGESGAKAAKGCAVHAGSAAKLKSCCQNSTFNQETEAKERKEAAVCVKLVNSSKASKS